MGSNATVTAVDTKPENEAAAHASIHDETIGHGNTPAAWTCVLIMMIGGAVSSVAYINASFLWFFIGLGLMVLGLAVGFILKKAGYGVGGSKLSSNGH